MAINKTLTELLRASDRLQRGVNAGELQPGTYRFMGTTANSGKTHPARTGGGTAAYRPNHVADATGYGTRDLDDGGADGDPDTDLDDSEEEGSAFDDGEEDGDTMDEDDADNLTMAQMRAEYQRLSRRMGALKGRMGSGKAMSKKAMSEARAIVARGDEREIEELSLQQAADREARRRYGCPIIALSDGAKIEACYMSAAENIQYGRD